jgi:hypothetical protein
MAVISNGTTLIDNGILDAAVPTGKMILLSTQTASASATISFTSGIDSTYDSYVFKFINIHPATDSVQFDFNVSTDGGSNYNVAKTSAAFRAYHLEDDSGSGLGYRDDLDLAQGTGFQNTIFSLGNGADESCAGSLQIFNPSSDTFVKHYISTLEGLSYTDLTVSCFVSGYANTTSAVNAVRFQMSSGNIDSGVIKLYGIGG